MCQWCVVTCDLHCMSHAVHILIHCLLFSIATGGRGNWLRSRNFMDSRFYPLSSTCLCWCCFHSYVICHVACYIVCVRRRTGLLLRMSAMFFLFVGTKVRPILPDRGNNGEKYWRNQTGKTGEGLPSYWGGSVMLVRVFSLFCPGFESL